MKINKNNNNPFTFKKSKIFDFINKKNTNNITPVTTEKSVYNKPGVPYTITAKLLHCTPIIPIYYKLFCLIIEENPNTSYKKMYNFYIDNKKNIDEEYSKYINIILGIKIEQDITRSDSIKIRNDLNSFITDWSSISNENDHSIKIFSHMKNDSIEETDIIVSGCLSDYKEFFKVFYNGTNTISNELINAIGSSNEIYKNTIFDDSFIMESNIIINTVFMDDNILEQINEEQYNESIDKEYIDKFYNETKDDSTIIVYIDNYDDIVNNIKEYFSNVKNIYDDTLNIVRHIYNMCSIIIFKDNKIIKIKLYDLIKNYLLSSNKDNEVYNNIIHYMESQMNFKINQFKEYDLFSLYFNNIDSYDNVDEIIEEEDIII